MYIKQRGASPSPGGTLTNLESFGIKDYQRRVQIDGRLRNNLRSKICLDDSYIRTSRHGADDDDPGSPSGSRHNDPQIDHSLIAKIQMVEGGIMSRTLANGLDLMLSQKQLEKIQRKEAARVAESNYEQPIFLPKHQNFTRLCPKEQYEQYSATCGVCQNNCERLFAAKGKNCPFCGLIVCSKCMKRKRPVPNHPEDFVNVCDGCHKDYLHIMLQERYLRKRKEREERLTRTEKQYDKSKSEIMKLQAIIEHYKQKNIRGQIEHDERIDQIKKQITITTEMIDKMEDENQKLNAQFQDINLRKREVDLTQENLKREHDELLQQFMQIQREHTEASEQEQKVNLSIIKVETKMAQAKHQQRKNGQKSNSAARQGNAGGGKKRVKQTSGYSSENGNSYSQQVDPESEYIELSQISNSHIDDTERKRSSAIQNHYQKATSNTLKKLSAKGKSVDAPVQNVDNGSCFGCFRVRGSSRDQRQNTSSKSTRWNSELGQKDN